MYLSWVDELVASSEAGFTDSGGSLALWGVELPSQADATQQEELDEANREYQSADRETLGESIRAACEVSRTRDKGKFLPNDALESIVTRERVREGLSNHKLGQPVHLEYLADEIWDNDLYDKDLPFILLDEAHPGQPQLCRKRKNGTTELIQFLNKWRIPVRESFDNNQWQLLAPYFTLLTESNRTVLHYPLADRIILPLIESDEVKQGPGHAEGGFGDVWRVTIHPFHHNCCKNTDDPNENPSYAVKRLHHSNKEAFDVEVSNLKRFSAKDHVHLIKLHVTFSWRDQYYLLFPWADGNLLTFWKSLYPEPSYPPRDHNLAAWFSKECLGIAHGLQMIHTAEIPSSDRQPCETSLRIHGRHGDLKPENILWFKSYEGTEQGKFGVLKISDFGLTRFHGTQSKSHFENVAVSATYRPPEFDVAMMVSQGFDIWSLGCVLLEFVTWYLLGGAGVEKFSSDRAKDDSREIHQDVFFNFVQIKEKNGDLQLGARAKQSVVNEFQTLYQQENLSDFMLDLLTFIKRRLLRVRPQNRANCKEIVEKFEAFHKECLNNPIYCTKRFKKIPERTGTGLSELSASTVHLSKAKTDQINRNNLPEHKGPLEDDIPSSQPSSSSSIGSQPDTRIGYGSMMRSVSPERLQSSFRGSPIMRSISPERIQSGLKGKAPEKMGTVPEEKNNLANDKCATRPWTSRKSRLTTAIPMPENLCWILHERKFDCLLDTWHCQGH